MKLPSPQQLKLDFPCQSTESIASWRRVAKQILQRKDERLIVIVGPCSIHERKSALEYAHLLKKLTPEIESHFFPIMRLFIEKPRTKMGWKGMIYDPHLDGTNDIVSGLIMARKLAVEIAEIGVPCATEILEPIIAPYFDDLLVWALIGARTSASQPHRQVASGLDFPVGFKNDCQGELDTAISGILTSRAAHSHIGIDSTGHVAAVETKGNPFTHLVLRGSDKEQNYDQKAVAKALNLLQEHRLEPRILIDCSHGNSGKDPMRQKAAFESVIEQAAKNKAIAGLMLESHLYQGKQPLGDDPSLLNYGVSITDPCLGWEETAHLLKSAICAIKT
ncbi:MAG: 3-deoxy-7-phosphoheptulonate synthase [Chlamydiae bacterium CG10_big_fil_rev_8_21_14_0_10_42_34]|nr:MAG: 3-deoxy-7-phosphoheptulonate synthase [Chlamydiae bacterium CG10_big_fil_rev_8_21_14_0_10_42_34]